MREWGARLQQASVTSSRDRQLESSTGGFATVDILPVPVEGFGMTLDDLMSFVDDEVSMEGAAMCIDVFVNRRNGDANRSMRLSTAQPP